MLLHIRIFVFIDRVMLAIYSIIIRNNFKLIIRNKLQLCFWYFVFYVILKIKKNGKLIYFNLIFIIFFLLFIELNYMKALKCNYSSYILYLLRRFNKYLIIGLFFHLILCWILFLLKYCS
jgi:hypothetical protein